MKINILEIYKKYYLSENLQMHMLRVAACSNLIIDNWIGKEIDKASIIRVCLLHDMGNMVKIPEDFSKNEEKANHLIECSLGIEKQIMEHCKIKPEDINDSSIKTYI